MSQATLGLLLFLLFSSAIMLWHSGDSHSSGASSGDFVSAPATDQGGSAGAPEQCF